MKKFLLKKKFLLRIFSLFAGLFIWMYVVSSAEIEVTINAPLNIELPKGLAIKNEFERAVSYRFKGPGLLVRKLMEKDIQINIAKKQYYKKRKSKYNINIEDFNFKLPISVEQVSVSPRVLSIELERATSKMVPIKPQFSAAILENYNVKALKTFPKKVKIEGPRSVIRGLKFIETKLIEDLKLTEGDSFFVDLVDPDTRVKLEENSVNVSYTLQSKKIRSTFEGVAIVFQSTSMIKDAFPKTVKVTVTGDEKKINSLRQEDIHVIASIPKKNTGKQEIELITELPQGIKLVKINPSKVSVELE